MSDHLRVKSSEFIDETNRVYIVIDDPKKGKKIKTQKFTPFCWTKSLRGSGFYDDDLDKEDTGEEDDQQQDMMNQTGTAAPGMGMPPLPPM